MLAKRIIPTFLYRGTTLVKGIGFDSWRSIGNVLQAARIYGARNVDELCIFDIGATPERRGPDFELIQKICDKNFTPIMVGGGIRSVEDVQKVLDSGADKVAICSALKESPHLVEEIARRYGSQVLCAVIEFDGAWWLGSLRKKIRYYIEMGVGEIMLQATDRDGTMAGYWLDIVDSLQKYIDVPMIISGGCSGYEDMRMAIQAGADAVAVGALFQFTDATPLGAAEYLHERGVCVRL